MMETQSIKPLATPRTIIVRRLFISPGHNYFGHHGQPAGTNPIEEVKEIECVPGQGIRGDRFFGFKGDYKGQITFFSEEVFRDLLRQLCLPPETSPGITRRNVITRGVDLNSLIDQEFEIQGLRFSGVEECRPCHWMNDAFGDKRAESLLKGNGGLRARILVPGVLRVEPELKH